MSTYFFYINLLFYFHLHILLFLPSLDWVISVNKLLEFSLFLMMIWIWSRRRKEWFKLKGIISLQLKLFTKWQLLMWETVPFSQGWWKDMRKFIFSKIILKLFLRKLMNKMRSVFFPSKIRENSLIIKNKRTIISEKWKIQSAKHQEVQLKDSWELTSTRWEKKKKKNRKEKSIKTQEKHHQLIDPLNFYLPKYQKQCINQGKSRWHLDKEK